MNIRERISRDPIPYYLFLAALLIRGIYLWLVQSYIPVKFLSQRFDGFALVLLQGKKHHALAGWGSFHILLAPLYKMLELLGALEYRVPIVLAINALLGALSVSLFFFLARRIFPDSRKTQVILSVIFLVYYPGIYFNALVVSENLFTPLFIILFLILLRLDNPRVWDSFYLGLVFGFCLILRPIVLSFLPFFVLWLFFVYRWNLRRLLVFFLLPLLVGTSAIAWTCGAINYRYHKHKAFSFADNGGLNFALTWCKPRRVWYHLPDKESFWFSPPIFWSKDKSTDINTDVPFARQPYYYRLGLRCMREHPEYLVTNLANIKNIFYSKLYPDLIKTDRHKSLIQRWRTIGPILLIGLLIFPFLSVSGRKEWLLGAAAFLSVWLSVYAGNPGEERYIIPYYFILLLWGGPGLYLVFRRFIERHCRIERPSSKGFALTSSALAVLVAVFLFWPLFSLPMAGSSEDPKFTRNVKNAARRAAFWLARNQRDNGSFVYRRHAKTYKSLKGDNLVRQLLASQGLANALRYFKDEPLVKAHGKNLEFVLSLLAKEDSFSYVRSPSSDRHPINSSVFALLTLLESPLSKSYVDEIRRLGEFILFMQKEDGSFRMLYPLAENDKLTPKNVYNMERFASGEALLACVALYEQFREQKYLDCATKGFSHYSPRITKQLNPSFSSWHAIAYSRLYALDARLAYRDTVNQLAGYLMKLQNPRDAVHNNPGGFDKKGRWWTSAEAVFCEALGYAFRLNHRNNDELAEKHYQSNKLGLENLMHFQLSLKDPPQIAGGIKCDKDVEEIYVDNVGHALMAFHEYLSRK